jgi:hypothetical protein
MKEQKVIPPNKPVVYKEMAALPPRNPGDMPDPIASDKKSESPKENVKPIAEQEKK